MTKITIKGLSVYFHCFRLIIGKVKPKTVTKDLNTDDYYLLTEDVIITAATSSVVDVNDNKTMDPLSRFWTSVYRKSSKKSISKLTTEVDHSLRARGSSLTIEGQSENTSNKSTSRRRETVM